MRERLQSFFSSLVQRVRKTLWSRVGLLSPSGDILSLHPAAVASKRPTILLVGREWYEETVERLPDLQWTEMRRVLRLKHGQNSRMVYLSGRADSGVRLVHVFRLVDAASQFTDDAAWVVPESALVVKGLDSAGVLEINRFGSRYFVASDQPSQLAGGLVSSAGLYGMSVGVRDPEAVQVIGDEDFLNTMRRSLRLLSIVDWLGFLNQPRMLLRLARLKRPAAIAATIVASYLLLASAWLWWVTQTREAAANALSPSVSTLLQKQRRIDEFAAEYAVIAERWSQRQAGVVVWWLAAEVWKQNGAVTSASFANGEAVLQGTAQSATGLLSSLSEAPSVESVRFNGPVTRLSDEAEQFSLTVKMRDDSYLGGGDRAP